MNRRTGFITAGAVVGALAAGSIAVAANIGILNAADSGPIGDLPATVETIAPAEAQVVDIYIEEPTTVAPGTVVVPGTTEPQAPATTDAAVRTQEFTVEDAGTVTVSRSTSGVDLGEVVVASGWTWTMEQSSPEALDVTFTGPYATYVFHATAGPDDTIEASVDQPIVEVIRVPAPSQPATPAPAQPAPSAAPAATTPAPAATVPNTVSYDDDDRYEHEDDVRYEHEDDDRYEGGEDDD